MYCYGLIVRRKILRLYFGLTVGKDGGFMRQDLMAAPAFVMILYTEKRRMRTVTVTCGIIKKSLPAKCGERLKVFL